MITPENFDKEYVDTVEEHQIDKFVLDEFIRQIHRYIKAMHGTKTFMDDFTSHLRALPFDDCQKAVTAYIDMNRKVLDGLDLKIVLARAICNYCDTFQYMLEMMRDKRKLIYYYQRMKRSYIRFHKVIEENGKYGIADCDGNVILQPQYDFVRTCFALVDNVSGIPVIAEKDGHVGIVLADGHDTVLVPFEYDNISLRNEPPYFEGEKNGKKTLLRF